jgi:hypothetical protein
MQDLLMRAPRAGPAPLTCGEAFFSICKAERRSPMYAGSLQGCLLHAVIARQESWRSTQLLSC